MSTKISFYNQNTARNALRLTINGVEFYFSYNTLVGVSYCRHASAALTQSEQGWITAVIKNYWGNTTGKHLNWIDGGDKESRLDADAFSKAVKEAMLAAKIDAIPTISI